MLKFFVTKRGRKTTPGACRGGRQECNELMTQRQKYGACPGCAVGMENEPVDAFQARLKRGGMT